MDCKVSAVVSLFVYLDLRWRQGLWRAHTEQPAPPLGSVAASSPRLGIGEVVLRQRSGLHWALATAWPLCKNSSRSFKRRYFKRQSLPLLSLLEPRHRGRDQATHFRNQFGQCRIPVESRPGWAPIISMSGGRSLGVRVGCSAMHTVADLRPWAQGISQPVVDPAHAHTRKRALTRTNMRSTVLTNAMQTFLWTHSHLRRVLGVKLWCWNDTNQMFFGSPC